MGPPNPNPNPNPNPIPNPNPNPDQVMGPPTEAEADAMESPFARTMLESLQPPSRVIGWKARLPNPSPNPHPHP